MFAAVFQAMQECEISAGPGMARIDAVPGTRKHHIVDLRDTKTTRENNIVVVQARAQHWKIS